MIVPLRAF